MNEAAVVRLVRLANSLRLTPADLDEIVHDFAQEGDLEDLNNLESEDDQENHITQVESDASEINNKGLEGQLKFLLEQTDEEHIAVLLREIQK